MAEENGLHVAIIGGGLAVSGFALAKGRNSLGLSTPCVT
jgi:hypothetical protein